jgi:large subunit ribosomal protein L32e
MWRKNIMAEIKKSKRKKPKFFRKDWHKKVRLGKAKKSKRKWRAARGIHNKIRLKIKGQARKPSIGYGENKKIKGEINGLVVLRIENMGQLEKISNEKTKDKKAIIIANVGKKKREEIIKKSKDMGLTILNKYKKKKTNQESS